jgi:GxxExxY protein
MTNLSHGSELTERVIGLAIDVHRTLGPGLLESAYEECLCFELRQGGIQHERQVPLPILYKEVHLNCGYRMDIVVERELIIEVKSVDRLLPIHDAQMLRYLRLSDRRIGLLMNFNTIMLRDGIRRLVM